MKQRWKPWGPWTTRQRCLLTTDGPGLKTKILALREELQLHFLRGAAAGIVVMWVIDLLKRI